MAAVDGITETLELLPWCFESVDDFTDNSSAIGANAHPDHIKQALRARPNDPALHYRLYQALAPSQRAFECLMTAGLLTLEMPDRRFRRFVIADEVLCAAASVWIDAGAAHVAADACARALSVFEDHPALRVQWGRALLALNNPAGALRQFLHAWRMEPGSGGFAVDHLTLRHTIAALFMSAIEAPGNSDLGASQRTIGL